MKLIPDFGTYLVEKGIDRQFKFQVFEVSLLGKDSILGNVFIGTTGQCCLSEMQNPIILEREYLYTIYLGAGSLTKAKKIQQQFIKEGIFVKVREDQKYLSTNKLEWIVPLQYIKTYAPYKFTR